MIEIIDAKIPESELRRRRYYPGLVYIKISWINTYFFCPYQLYLSQVKKVKVPETEDMKIGASVHQELKRHHDRGAIELRLEDALTLSQMEVKGYKYREVPLHARFTKYQLGGFADEIVILPNRIIIVDDKKGRTFLDREDIERMYHGALMQIYAYSLTFQKIYNVNREITAMVRDRDTGEEIISVVFGDKEKNELFIALDNIYNILKEYWLPDVKVNVAKCSRCRYRDVCPYYLSYISKENSNKGL